MSKVLVLGGNGFIGSHLIDSLVEAGHEVTCLSKLNGQRPTNLLHIEDKIRIIDGDFFDASHLDRVLGEGAEYVFPMVSFGTPGSAVADIQKNLDGTLTFLDLCVRNNVKRVINPSSGGTVYGNQPGEQLGELAPTAPISFYGQAKLEVEKRLAELHANHGLDYLTFRISNPYGPRQNPFGKQGLIAVSLYAIREGRPITVFGDGEATRDYIYVTDVADLMVDVFNIETQSRIYNLSSGIGYSINHILDVYRKLGLDFEVNYLPAREGDVLHIVPDPSRIITEFQFQPRVDFESGVGLTLEYIDSVYKEMHMPIK